MLLLLFQNTFDPLCRQPAYRQVRRCYGRHFKHHPAAVGANRLNPVTGGRNAGYLPAPTLSVNKFRNPERQPDADECLDTTGAASAYVPFG